MSSKEELPQNAPEPELTALHIPLHVLLERYLLEISSKKSPTTQAQESRVARHLTAKLGTTLLFDLTPLALTHFRDARLQAASAGTVARELSLLAAVFEAARTLWDIPLESNPLNAVTAPPTVRGRGRQLRPGERLRLLSACHRHSNPMLGWVVGLILETGMRKGEVLSLHRSQVDLSKRVVHLPRNGTSAPRDIPLTHKAVALFQAALHYTQETPETPLIFFGEPGKFGRRKPYTVDRVLRQVISRGHLRAFSCDDLRDDAITRMQEAGLTEQEIAAITGTRAIRIDRRAAHLQVETLLHRLDTLGL